MSQTRPGTALELLNEALQTREQLGYKVLADEARLLKLTAEAAERSPALPKPA